MLILTLIFFSLLCSHICILEKKFEVTPTYLNLTSPVAERIKLTLKESINEGRSEPLLTLFTTWNNHVEKYLVHNITVKNWAALRTFVIPIVFTDESSVASECREKGWLVHPIRVASSDGFPVMKYMYEDVMSAYNTTFYAYSNSDILYTDTLIDTLIAIGYNRSEFKDTKTNKEVPVQIEQSYLTQTKLLIVGRRYNLENVTKNEASSFGQLTSTTHNRGTYFGPWAIDYFITSKAYPWKDIPELTIGRQVYDIWLVSNARYQNHVVIDASNTILASHQTTHFGNYESRLRKNKHYDLNILKGLYKFINLRAGTVLCAEYMTKYKFGSIVLSQRNVSRDCALLNETQVMNKRDKHTDRQIYVYT